MPFYVGDVFGRMSENRKNVLEMSQKYLNEYLKLLDHYELLDKDVYIFFIFDYRKNYYAAQKPMEKNQ